MSYYPGGARANFGRENSMFGGSQTAATQSGSGFIFDIIVVRVDVPGETFQNPNSLSVDVKFHNANLKITSSRINVVDFRSGRSYEFSTTPLQLKENLKANPLQLELKYESKSIGKTELQWPETFISQINDCGGELTHSDEGELKNADGTKIGTIEVIIRLQTKCKEYTDPDFSLSQMPENMCKQMEKVIDPNDILFVVGEDNSACNCAQVGIIPASDSEKSLNPTCLDLSSFRNVNGKVLTSPDILNTLDNMHCSQTQKVAHQYHELMNGSTSKGCRESQPCGSKNKQSNLNFSQSRKSFPNGSTSESTIIPCCCRSDDEDFACQNMLQTTGNEPCPNLTQTTVKRSRCCPVCKTNVSWLPKFAACPKCGYKGVPTAKETPFNEKITASEILKDFLNRKSSCSDMSSSVKDDEEKNQCCCTCANGDKVCAYCRVRKLFEDMLQPASNKECNCERKSSEIYNVCETGSSNSCRPYLARVFSELKDLYDLKDSKEQKEKKNDRCEKLLNTEKLAKKGHNTAKPKGQSNDLTKPDKNANSVNKTVGKQTTVVAAKKAQGDLSQSKMSKRKLIEKERKKYLVKNFKKNQSVCKNQMYTYRPVRDPVLKSKTAHKACISRYIAKRKNVPSNMGWLWNLEAKGSRAGWKPGAIRKPIRQLMKYFLKDFPADTIRVSQYAYRRKGENKEESELIQQPTLHIYKKDGEYTITLRPLKDPEALKQCADPYLDMKPIQFKIVKNPIVLEMRKLKRYLKDMGFSKCTCHKPISYCYCRSFLDNKRLEYQCNKETRKRCLPNVTDQLVLSDTTDSEVEFDFGVTPPAGVVKPNRLRKPDLVNHGTQYVEGDWNIRPMYPRQPNKYMKSYNCAIGERFGKGLTPYGEGGYKPGAKVDHCGLGRGNRGQGGRGGGKGGTDFLRQKGGSGDGKDNGAKGGGKGGEDGKDGKGGKGGKGDGKVDMLKYLQQKNKEDKKKNKERGKNKMLVPPPLLCMIDRKAKPFNPCAPCLPCQPCNPCSAVCCNGVCQFNPRIC